MGIPFDAAGLAALCRKHGLWLIEDCCDALGTKLAGRHVGTFGDLATVSFYPAHHITMGEGGAVVTDDSELARVARSFRDWGRDCHCKGGKSTPAESDSVSSSARCRSATITSTSIPTSATT